MKYLSNHHGQIYLLLHQKLALEIHMKLGDSISRMDVDFSDLQIQIDQLYDLKIKSMEMAEFHYPLTEVWGTYPMLD